MRVQGVALAAFVSSNNTVGTRDHDTFQMSDGFRTPLLILRILFTIFLAGAFPLDRRRVSEKVKARSAGFLTRHLSREVTPTAKQRLERVAPV